MENRESLENELALLIASYLKDEIVLHGEAVLAVSGGSTPDGLFEKLSKTDMDWEKVTIIPVDERLLPNDHEDQNGKKIRSLLLKNKARVAKFISFVYDLENAERNLELAEDHLKQLKFPITVCVLGMGNDGHTASIFPCSPEIKDALKGDGSNRLISVSPQTAPYKRVSLVANMIHEAKHLILHIYGAEKQKVLEKARDVGDPLKYPVSAFLKHEQLKIYWSN